MGLINRIKQKFQKKPVQTQTQTQTKATKISNKNEKNIMKIMSNCVFGKDVTPDDIKKANTDKLLQYVHNTYPKEESVGFTSAFEKSLRLKRYILVNQYNKLKKILSKLDTFDGKLQKMDGIHQNMNTITTKYTKDQNKRQLYLKFLRTKLKLMEQENKAIVFQMESSSEFLRNYILLQTLVYSIDSKNSLRNVFSYDDSFVKFIDPLDNFRINSEYANFLVSVPNIFITNRSNLSEIIYNFVDKMNISEKIKDITIKIKIAEPIMPQLSTKKMKSILILDKYHPRNLVFHVTVDRKEDMAGKRFAGLLLYSFFLDVKNKYESTRNTSRLDLSRMLRESIGKTRSIVNSYIEMEIDNLNKKIKNLQDRYRVHNSNEH